MNVLFSCSCKLFRHQPLMILEPKEFSSYGSGSLKVQALQVKVNTMLLKGALEIISVNIPASYNKLLLVEKASGRWRPVIYLSPLNSFSQLSIFKMEIVISVVASIKKGDIMFSLNMKDAYNQIPIHP